MRIIHSWHSVRTISVWTFTAVNTLHTKEAETRYNCKRPCSDMTSQACRWARSNIFIYSEKVDKGGSLVSRPTQLPAWPRLNRYAPTFWQIQKSAHHSCCNDWKISSGQSPLHWVLQSRHVSRAWKMPVGLLDPNMTCAYVHEHKDTHPDQLHTS